MQEACKKDQDTVCLQALAWPPALPRGRAPPCWAVSLRQPAASSAGNLCQRSGAPGLCSSQHSFRGDSLPGGAQGSTAGPPKLLVFGGNGYVGTRVCQEALKTGLSVVSISRGGRPPVQADWVPQVEWVQARPAVPVCTRVRVRHTPGAGRLRAAGGPGHPVPCLV